MDTSKNYKYGWTVDQRAILESGLNIDIVDFSIIRMLSDFATSGSCKKMAEEGIVFYMFRWSLIKSQLPILKLNTRQSVKRRMNKLIEAKLIAPHPDNQQTRTSWFRFAENKDGLFQHGAKKGENSVNEKLQLSTKTTQNSQQIVTETVTNGLHSVNNGLLDCNQSFTQTVTNGLHDTITNNINIDNTEETLINGKFKPPNIEQVKIYCQQKGMKEEYAQAFIDFNFNRDWKLNNNKKMKSWKAAFRISMTYEWNDKYKIKNPSGDPSRQLTQKQAKETIRKIFAKHKDKWGNHNSKYGRQAQTDFVKALKLFYKDFPQLKEDATS